MDEAKLPAAISKSIPQFSESTLEDAIEQQKKINEISHTMKRIWLELHKNKRQFEPDEITLEILSGAEQ